MRTRYADSSLSMALFVIAFVIYSPTLGQGPYGCGPLVDIVIEGMSRPSLGVSLSGLSDINHDFMDDYIVGEPAYLDMGQVFVFHGTPHNPAVLTGSGQFGARFGELVASAKDFDGDSIPDIVVSAYFEYVDEFTSGKVYVFSGADFSLIGEPITIPGSSQFGVQIGVLDDFYPSYRSVLAIGAEDGEHFLSLFEYQNGSWVIISEWQSTDEFPSFVTPGDINADGLHDVIINEEGDFTVYSSTLIPGVWDSLTIPNDSVVDTGPAFDIDRDGINNFFVVGVGSDDLWQYQPDGGCGVLPYCSVGAPGLRGVKFAGLNYNGDCFSSVAVLEINEEGRSELHLYDYDPFTNAFVWITEVECGSGGLLARPPVESPDAALVGDRDGDFVRDVIWSSEFSLVSNGDRRVCISSCNPGMLGERCLDLWATPLIAGQDATFVVSLAQPQEMTYLSYSLQGYEPGTWVPGLGIELDLVKPELVAAGKLANNKGLASWTVTVPNAAADRWIWFQAAQEGRKSRLLRRIVLE